MKGYSQVVHSLKYHDCSEDDLVLFHTPEEYLYKCSECEAIYRMNESSGAG